MLWRLVLAICFITTFSVGIGIVALPIVVGLAGFWPGVTACCFTWIYVLITGLLYAEATLANPDGANVGTISRNFLGKAGNIIASTAFIYIHFCIITAYFLFGAPLIVQLIHNYFGISLPIWIPYLGLLFIFGGSVLAGINWCIRFNIFLTIGLFGFMLYILISGADHVSKAYLTRTNWIYIVFAIPSFYNAFYYQSIIPSLATFLKRNWVSLKTAIWFGTTFAFLFFIFWIWLTVGLTTDLTITTAFETNQPIFKGIQILNQTPYIGKATLCVTFFAIIASLLAAGIALVDFYSDLFGIPVENRKGKARLAVCYLVILPPFFLSILSRLNIMTLLNSTVGFAQLLTSAMIPLAWILAARYIRKIPYQPRLKLNRIALFIFVIVTFLFLYLEGIQLVRLSIAP